MDFYVLIPARLESTRLKNKMLQDLHGLPLVIRTARQAQLSQARQVFIATDNNEIAAAATTHGIRPIMTGPHDTGTDRLAAAAQQLQLPQEAIIVNVQGDEPLIDPQLINAVAKQLAINPQAEMATAAAALNSFEQLFNPNVVKVVCNQQQQALYFSRAPIPWVRDQYPIPTQLPQLSPHPTVTAALHHIGIYAYRNHFLQRFPTLPSGTLEHLESLEQLRALEHGATILVHRWSAPPAPGVDTAEDLALVRQILAQQGTCPP